AAGGSHAGLPAVLPAPRRPGAAPAVDLDHHGHHRADRLDGRRPPGARGVPHAPGAGVRDLVGVDRRRRLPRGVPAHPAERPGAGPGGHDPGHPRRHPDGVRSLLSRTGRPATLRHLGQYPQRRQGRPRDRVVDDALPGSRDPGHGALLQPHGGRDPRRARPAAAADARGAGGPPGPLEHTPAYVDNPRAPTAYSAFAGPKWRNWQTRTFEGRVGQPVGVRVPPSAPFLTVVILPPSAPGGGARAPGQLPPVRLSAARGADIRPTVGHAGAPTAFQRSPTGANQARWPSTGAGSVSVSNRDTTRARPRLAACEGYVIMKPSREKGQQ